MAVVDHGLPRWYILVPFVEERVQHILSQLDDVDTSGLRGFHAGHILRLLAPETGAVEQVPGGAAVQEGLEYRGKA